ncbi:MAG: hypothetical protein ACT443_00260 [Gemmatimonadota bacterium]
MQRALLLSLFFFTACSSSTDFDGVRVLGTIKGFDDNDPHVDIVGIGRFITVTVVTYGDNCFSVAETEVRLNGMTAFVTPYDLDRRCPERIQVNLSHVATVQFPGTGTAEIVVRGLDASVRNESGSVGDTVETRFFVDVP